MMVLWSALVSLAWATSPVELNAAWSAFNTGAEHALPALTERQQERLLRGKLVKYRKVGDPGAPQRVVGMQILPMDRARIWAAARSEDVDYEGTTFWLVPGAPEDRERWYQWMDIPYPFADRHFVIDVWDNQALAKATGGKVWEHPWAIAQQGLPVARAAVTEGKVKGLTEELYDKSVLVDTNNGAWVAIALGPKETLAVFHVQTVIGGNIPDKLIADYMMLTMKKLFKDLTRRAATCETWFKPGKLITPDGQLLELPER